MATTENENMIVTENIELKAPKGDAFYDISYVAENNEILDKEIKKSNEHIDNLENPHKVTAKQVGLGNVPNVATNDQAPTYTEASTLATLTSGEKLSIAFGKIKCAITRLIDHIANTTMHITANERAAWNAKASTAVVSTSANGLCPKRGGTTTKFLRDDGTWAVPPNTTYGTATTSSAGLMSAAMVTKLNGIATGATKNTVDSALSSTSTNPIQNKVVNAALEEINSNLTKLTASVRPMGLVTKTDLNFAESGIYRISGLTSSNSPSGADTDGILINMPAVYTGVGSTTASLQFFYGQSSNTLYVRLQWYDNWTRSWIKISN